MNHVLRWMLINCNLSGHSSAIVILVFFFNGFSASRHHILDSSAAFDSTSIKFLREVWGRSFVHHQRYVLLFGIIKVSVAWDYLRWISDELTRSTECHSCLGVSSSTRNSRSLLRLWRMNVWILSCVWQRNLSGIEDLLCFWVLNLLSLDVFLLLLDFRLTNLNTSAHEFLVTSRDLFVFPSLDVCLQLLDSLLHYEVLCLHIT